MKFMFFQAIECGTVNVLKSKVAADLGLSKYLLELLIAWPLSGFPTPTDFYAQSSRHVTCFHRC